MPAADVTRHRLLNSVCAPPELSVLLFDGLVQHTRPCDLHGTQAVASEASVDDRTESREPACHRCNPASRARTISCSLSLFILGKLTFDLGFACHFCMDRWDRQTSA